MDLTWIDPECQLKFTIYTSEEAWDVVEKMGIVTSKLCLLTGGAQKKKKERKIEVNTKKVVCL